MILHHTVHRTTALVLATVGVLVTLAGCAIGSSSSSSASLRTLATFRGSRSGTTSRFVTSGDWVLSWNCDPTVLGVETPFSLTINVYVGERTQVEQPVVTSCQEGNTQGAVGVRQSGEQWLAVWTGDTGGNWTVTVEVPATGTSARLVPTSVPTSVPPTPTDTPAPPVARLPLTLTGEGTPYFNTDQFTANVQWHYAAHCVNPPGNTGTPYALTIRVDEPSDANISGYTSVGQQLDMYCNGTTVDSDTVHPGGYPPGVYGWDVVTSGNWTITVLPEY